MALPPKYPSQINLHEGEVRLPTGRLGAQLEPLVLRVSEYSAEERLFGKVVGVHFTVAVAAERPAVRRLEAEPAVLPLDEAVGGV